MQEETEDEIMGKAIEHVIKEHIYIYIYIYIKADSMSPEFREN
jgi:hypothetical protein